MSFTPFQNFPGNAAAVERLRSSIQAGNAHGYLLSGPAGVGKRLLANHAAAMILGVTLDDLARSPNCLRLAPPIDEKMELPKTTTPVEDVHEFIRTLSLSPLGGTHKVGIIESAETLNAHGQNALLKTLEEPPAGTIVFLLVDDPELILPTLRSRLVHIALTPDAAAALIIDPERAERMKRLRETAHHLITSPLSARLTMIGTLTKGDDAAPRRELEELLVEIAGVTRTSFLEKCGTMSPEHLGRFARAFAAVLTTREQLRTNANAQILFSSLAIHLP